MAHAIDRKAVIDLVMSGYGTAIGSHWPPVTPYYEDMTGKFPYNPKKAKELLAKAGYPNGFEATIKLPAIYAYSKRAGEVIADMLGQVGIKLKIEIVEWGVWLDRIFKQKDFQLSMIGHAEAWDIGIYANPNYYFQYDSQEFQDAYANALKATTTEATVQVVRALPGDHRRGCGEWVPLRHPVALGHEGRADELVEGLPDHRAGLHGSVVEQVSRRPLKSVA